MPRALLAVVFVLAACHAERPAPAGGVARSSPPGAPSPAAPSASASVSASVSPSASVSASISPSALVSASVGKTIVHLVPLGQVPIADLEVAARGLAAQAPIAIAMEPRRALPSAAKSGTKDRYSASALLTDLEGVQAGPRDKVLGVAEIDLVTPKNGVADWGILGLGSMDGKTCVLSTFRMRRAWENGGAPEALVRERLWKVALHELGHTLGLPHCPNAGCIMQDGHGTVKTIDAEQDLCVACRARFTEALR